MAFKVVILCAVAFLVQADSQSRGVMTCSKRQELIKSIAGKSCSSGSGCCSSISIPTGGDFPVTSVGPISPSGIAVSSELGLSGDLNVNGELPWLSAVEFSGKYDTTGSGCVDYSCGSCGNVAITSVQGGTGCCGSK